MASFLQKLISDIKEIESRGHVLTMKGFITILENSLDKEKGQRIGDYTNGHEDREKDIYNISQFNQTK
jgi:hypothetical protein